MQCLDRSHVSYAESGDYHFKEYGCASRGEIEKTPNFDKLIALGCGEEPGLTVNFTLCFCSTDECNAGDRLQYSAMKMSLFFVVALTLHYKT